MRPNALEKGLIPLARGVYGNGIRFLAPIATRDEVFAEVSDIEDDSIRDRMEETK